MKFNDLGSIDGHLNFDNPGCIDGHVNFGNPGSINGHLKCNVPGSIDGHLNLITLFPSMAIKKNVMTLLPLLENVMTW